MKLIKSGLILFSLTVIILTSCGDEGDPMVMLTDNFDRKEMLEDWADLIIIPAFDAYNDVVLNLNTNKDAFLNNQNQENFENLRNAYIDAYKGWQKVSIFDIGKAEEITLRNFTNIFPTDATLIEANISNQNYNLLLPSNFDAQGFPALDYLLYGIAETDEDIIALLSTPNYATYLDDLITRLVDLTDEVVTDWNNGYRATFVDNNSASATASVDKLVNDFLFYYEKYLRAGKIGIPAGVFSSNSIATSVEAPYSSIYSKELFFEGFQAAQDFFVGQSFDGSTKGKSLEAYLSHIATQNEIIDISPDVIAQWALATTTANSLSESFKDQVLNDNIKMLQTYDELQKAVVLLKVDMMQLLNIQVDYVDADGD